ncbi:MAG: UDP-N-acetylmuramate dehydrogenase [Bacteroidota bacterium]
MITHNINLQRFNSFGVEAIAEQYLRLTSIDELNQLALNESPNLVLGDGSNLLLLDQVPGLTLHVANRGIEVLNQGNLSSNPSIQVRVGAGINWHQFVLYTLEKGWHGLENLALIPGTVGAAPVQNIGAYGVEVAERIHAVHVYEYGKGTKQFSPEECSFSYRNSLFKRHPGRFLITAVDFNLGGNYVPNTSYGAIKDKLQENGHQELPTPRQIARAVIEIRAGKLPFWTELGNAGSFFKNPIVDQETFKMLRSKYPHMPYYPISEGQVKLPAGWLIDQAGWKGKRMGKVGCYYKQALVIVNHGGASGQEILTFSGLVQNDIQEKFDITLEREVQIVGQTKNEN